MLNPKLIRDNPEKIKQNTRERGMNDAVVDEWLQIDKEKTEVNIQVELLNKERNELAEIGKKGGNIEEVREKAREIKEKGKELEVRSSEIVTRWTDLINQIPNIHLADVPIGKNDAENKELRKVGEPIKFAFTPKDHLQLGTELGILDFETGAKVTGSQFYFLKNDAVKLELALLSYGVDFLAKKGFTAVMTPDMAKSRYYLGTGYAPRGDEAQIYEIEGEDLGLIATAEVTMAAAHADETIFEKDLPLKYAAISHCFRKEAGAYGKYSKGLYRVHQFTKLEMFIYCKPEDSDKYHMEILAAEEELTKSLGIPYRVLQMCSGDMGAMAAKKYDLEAWMPGRNDYGEITSTSNCTDYQSRNLNIKIKRENGEKEFIHMLNGTALVTSRIPIAILENFQQADGSVKVPEVLVPYMGKEVIGRL
ncbi:MAG: serine--tRNA ligase [bacterium]